MERLFKEMGTKCILCALILLINDVIAENLYAASIHWRPASSNGLSSDNEVIFSYKLIWKQESLRFCPIPNNLTQQCFFYIDGTLSATTSHPNLLPQPRWQGYKWKCTGGCQTQSTISTLPSLYYTDVGTFHEISWEAAMEMTMFKFRPGDDLANIKIGFYDSADQLVGGLGEGLFSMAIRNDTNRANISPSIHPLPYYRVPLGCSVTVPLFPFDGDGDYVRCHWQKFPHAGTLQSLVVLNEDTCEIYVYADMQAGFTAGQNIPVSLYAEDYSEKPVKFSKWSADISTGPFSRTPVMLLLHVSNTTQDCNSGPTFIEAGTLPPNSVRSYPLPFQNAKLPFKIPTDDGQVILTSGPRYMGFKRNILSDTIEGTWLYINDTSMTGIHQACGMAYTKDGVPGESRCAVLLVNEPDECPCPQRNGVAGTCRNLFEYHTCVYPPSPSRQQQQTMCKPVKPSRENNDDMGLKVGLPVGLSLLLLIIIIATAMYLKKHWMNKLNKSSINPKNMPNGFQKTANNINSY